MPIPDTVQIAGPLAPSAVTDTYNTHFANYGQGGVHHVTTLAERDAITALRRAVGMLCSVSDTGRLYKLEPDLVTWAELETGAQGTTATVAYNEVSPKTVFEVPAGQAIDSINVEVTQLWNGVGASCTIGVLADPDSLFVAGDIELTELAVYEKDCYLAGPATLIVAFNPGITPSQGQLRIQVSTVGS